MSEETADGGGTEFRRVVESLRARMGDGTYRLGDSLPTQRRLAQEFGVSRDTVQRALRELANEGWVQSRQGSGTRVIKAQRIHSAADTRPRPRLGPFIGEAFEAEEVTLDVFTLTSESLDVHVRLQAERVRAGEIAPQDITVRLLLPHESTRLAYPRAKEDPEDMRPLDRLRDISRRHTASLRSALLDLRAEGLVPHVDVQIRRVPLTPGFKLYLLGGTQALHGFYEVLDRPIELDNGEVLGAIDALGLGATLFHYSEDGDPGSQGSLFVSAAQAWFDSHWDLLGT
ncbi:winged helix-turn-helix domain-containing protein [Streptomyces sp. GC420]|uniref:winged helix-turn-helix domain-containing protein n=1 Tax=Streptomyces sp. GC420 TaxID=2697568 RepID=UPI001415136B|nr:winged helix-turn-helix domain-containing protein [Streptomyces sp. GC420]NBM17704.1 GntR family transcriptional regulator [Streptomyces sp. GC420]